MPAAQATFVRGQGQDIIEVRVEICGGSLAGRDARDMDTRFLWLLVTNLFRCCKFKGAQ